VTAFLSSLTEDERNAVAGYAQFHNQKDVARRLGICRKTVNVRIASAREKSGAKTTAELLWMYIRAANPANVGAYE